MGRWRSLLAAVLLTCLMPALPVSASETVSYAYDARGRLVSVVCSGTVNDGVSASYSYDKADNRANVAVTTGGGGTPPSFSVNDVSVTEGSPLLFTVSRAGSTSSNCSISYATANGTATSPTYYTPASGTLTFTPAQTTQTVSVTAIDKSRLNGTRTMYLNLSSPFGGGGGADAQGIGSITASGGGGCTTCRPSGSTGATEPPPRPPPPGG